MSKSIFTKKFMFWTIFVILSVVSVPVAIHFFPRAFPVLSLELSINRQQAMEQAKKMADASGRGPENFRQAASFSSDYRVKHYVELEAGGVEAFRKMCAENLYSPYTWKVRHFVEGRTKELKIWFTPQGTPYGFYEKISEDEPGADIDSEIAKGIAIKEAVEKWGVVLEDYKLVETSHEFQPSSRKDHTFVYERSGVRIGRGFYRLRLVVSGDRLTELKHYIQIPEGFFRRYEQMRSSNKMIRTIAHGAGILLYVLGGIVIGIFLLNRKNLVVWKWPLIWGIFIALFEVLAEVNWWPLQWMHYDTALSSNVYFLSGLLEAIITFIFWTCLYTATFMAAEGLTRRAFPHHIQFFRLWSKDTAGFSILGRTVGGYLGAALDIVYVTLFMLLCTRYFGWWVPSTTLIRPDILATPFPWLPSIAWSLGAGFWEECMFRAIPIAGAALIGRYLGRERLWIIAGFIIQALIFGGVHAMYAQQPAYARLIELILPSLVYGLIYLRFGLLPVIVCHFTYDVVWFALPVFTSSAPGLFTDRMIVVFLTLVPLWIVLFHWFRNKKLTTMQNFSLNSAWVQTDPSTVIFTQPKKLSFVPINRWVQISICILGIAGAGLWIGFSEFKKDEPRLHINRVQAIQLAREKLASLGINLPEDWTVSTSIVSGMGSDRQFIWEKEGRQRYWDLMGTYLSPVHWKLRFVRFSGDVEDRKEEYVVRIAGYGEVIRWTHNLPEARPGADISKDEARNLGSLAIAQRFDLDSRTLEEFSIISNKLEARTDWTIIWRDKLKEKKPLSEGDARIQVKISGDRITDASRYIHVPDEWTRKERNKNEFEGLIERVRDNSLGIIGIAGVVCALLIWSRRGFHFPVFMVFFAGMAFIECCKIINFWPSTMNTFSTASPFSHQIFRVLSGKLLNIGATALGAGAMAGLVRELNFLPEKPPRIKDIVTGFASGILVAAIYILLGYWFKHDAEPVRGFYSTLNTFFPVIGPISGDLKQYVFQTLVILIVITGISMLSYNWTRWRSGLICFMITGGMFMPNPVSDYPVYWICSGLFTGLAIVLGYIYFIRFNVALVPLTMGATYILMSIRQVMLDSHPAAISGELLSAFCIFVVSIFWYRLLLRTKGQGA
ncbi:CPBP family intramembrane metalloprotease [Desulfobacterales bacterium HSG16]|nr:CPBP family intramembrane metalloprotease [Desulfobacterales bacterium HSG16]